MAQARQRQWVRVRTDDGEWLEGWLEEHRVVDGVWQGFVRYVLGLTDQRSGWFTEDRVRGGRVGERV